MRWGKVNGRWGWPKKKVGMFERFQRTLLTLSCRVTGLGHQHAYRKSEHWGPFPRSYTTRRGRWGVKFVCYICCRLEEPSKGSVIDARETEYYMTADITLSSYETESALVSCFFYLHQPMSYDVGGSW